MATAIRYGDLTPFVVGMVLQGLVGRVCAYIRRNRFSFEVFEKIGTDGSKDVVTNVDREAQEMYLHPLIQCFPGYGIIAEENFEISSRHSEGFRFSIDPLDGTKAFIRGQSHGIGSMIALSCNAGDILVAYVGDVMTGEIYGFCNPYTSGGVYRYHEDGDPHALVVNEHMSLNDQDLLFEDPPDRSSMLTQNMTSAVKLGGLFKKYQVGSGGIGISMARLWKGEVGGIVLSPNNDTPWDLNPVVGISKQRGFKFIPMLDDDSIHQELMPALITTTRRGYELLVIHKSRFDEFIRWWLKFSRASRIATKLGMDIGMGKAFISGMGIGSPSGMI